jgi:hypothetical protein
MIDPHFEANAYSIIVGLLISFIIGLTIGIFIGYLIK